MRSEHCPELADSWDIAELERLTVLMQLRGLVSFFRRTNM